MRLGRPDDAALEQQLQRAGLAHQPDQRRHLGVRHHQPEVLDRRAKAAALTADADIRHGRHLQPAAHADAVDLRHHGMRAVEDGLRGAVHHAAVDDGLLLVGARGGEFGNIVAGREGAFARAAHDHAAHGGIAGQRAEDVAKLLPHGHREGVELGGAVEHHGGNGAIALEQQRRAVAGGIRRSRACGHDRFSCPMSLGNAPRYSPITPWRGAVHAARRSAATRGWSPPAP